MARLILVVLTLAALAACEGREAKLDRLRTDEAIASLTVLMHERAVERLEQRRRELPRVESPSPAEQDSMVRMSEFISQEFRDLQDARNRLDLVRRDIRRVLR